MDLDFNTHRGTFRPTPTGPNQVSLHELMKPIRMRGETSSYIQCGSCLTLEVPNCTKPKPGVRHSAHSEIDNHSHLHFHGMGTEPTLDEWNSGKMTSSVTDKVIC